jgi:hypothetical protein
MLVTGVITICQKSVIGLSVKGLVGVFILQSPGRVSIFEIFISAVSIHF